MTEPSASEDTNPLRARNGQEQMLRAEFEQAFAASSSCAPR